MGYLRGLADLPKNPPVTTAIVFICIGLFLLVNADPQEWQRTLELAGYRDAGQIWNGQWWALITSALLHVELWHLAFNLYWLWVLGGRLELQLGALRYLAFSLTAAFVTSAMQLTVSSETGIGYSGVGYAIFGLMWQSRASFPEFERVLTPRICGLFIAWMFGCLFMTWAADVRIGNTAHFSGLAFGCLSAPLLARTPRRRLGMAGVVLSVVVSVVTLCWSPWNPYWLTMQGYHAHLDGDYARAVEFYDAALARNPQMPGMRENRDDAAAARDQQRKD
jgi:rhomboid protease GluP